MPATKHDKALAKLHILARVVNVHYDNNFHVWPIEGDADNGSPLKGVGIRRKEDTAPDTPRTAIFVTEGAGEVWYQVRLALGEAERAEHDDALMDSVDRALCLAFGSLSDLWLLEAIQHLESCVTVMDGDSPEGKAALERAMQGVVRH